MAQSHDKNYQARLVEASAELVTTYGRLDIMADEENTTLAGTVGEMHKAVIRMIEVIKSGQPSTPSHVATSTPFCWMVTRDSEHEKPEIFQSEEAARQNACLGFNTTHITPLYIHPSTPSATATSEIEKLVVLNLNQAMQLLRMYGGENAEIALANGDGHSGPGLYAHFDEYPEEGAERLDPDRKVGIEWMSGK